MKRLFTITFFILACYGVWAQPSQVIPPSPNAANLGKHVEVPVSLYTGRPQMSVPIWTIEDGALSLPITVDYSFGGIKVSEIASWVGLGWSLNAGGVISRSQMGKADESNGGFLNSGAPLNPPSSGSQSPYLENLQAHANGVLDNQPDIFYYNFAGGSGKFVFDKNGNIHTIPRKNIKIERIGSRSFYNQSFVAEWKITTEDGIIYEFKAAEETENQIGRKKRPEGSFSWGGGSGSVNSWYLTRIVSPQGDEIKLNYTRTEYYSDFISSIVAHISINGGGCPEEELPSGITKMEQKVYGQRLSSIEWAGGKILFNAHSVKRADLNGDNALDNIVIQDYKGRTLRKFAFSYKILNGTSLLDYATTTSNATTYPQRRLILTGVKELNAAGTAKNPGYTFQYFTDKGLPNRSYLNTDHWGYANKADNAQSGSRLDYLYANGEYSISGRNPDINYGKQGSLYRVNYPTGGYSQFDFQQNQAGDAGAPLYIQKDRNAGLTTSHLSCLPGGIDDIDDDIMGLAYELVTSGGVQYKLYYQQFKVEGLTRTQGQDQVNIVATGMPNTQGMAISGCFGFYIKNMSTGSKVSISGATSSTDVTRDGTYTTFLQTGTYRLYHFPCPTILNLSNTDSYKTARYSIQVKWKETHPDTQGANTNAGGLRVQKITTVDPVNNKKLIKTYSYNYAGENTSSGKLMSAPCYMRDYTLLDRATCNYKLISTSSYYPLATSNGSYVGYEFVTETTTDEYGASLGKSEYKYSRMYKPNNPEFPPFSVIERTFPVTPPEDYDWCRGLLLEKTDYAAGSSACVQKTVNSYSFLTEGTIQGYLADYLARSTANISPSSVINRAFYNIPRGRVQLNSTTVTEYRNGTGVSKTTAYTYNTTSLLPVCISEDIGAGEKMNKYISYPQDYSPTGFITELRNKFIMNKPIEEVTAHVTSGGAVSILGGKIMTYHINGTPNQEYSLETAARIAQSGFKFSARATGVLPIAGTATTFGIDGRYKLRITYGYCTVNNRKRMCEIITDGLYTSYLWGYKGLYPVAKATADTNANLKAKLTAAEITAVEAGTYSDADMRTVLNKIRTAYAANPHVQVDTYTYSPLEGMTSATDAANAITFYEYDTFGRLYRVKDQNGYILKEQKYNFK